MNVCIFDDEPLAAEFLKHQLHNFNDINVLFTFTESLPDKTSNLFRDIDLVFLDIEMPEINGLELAEQITMYNPNIQIVFVTAHSQYALEAFEMHALDYLLKPVTVARLKKTLQRINKANSDIASNNKASSPQLLIKVLGDLEFQFNDKEAPQTINWRTAKSKELFLYLLQYEGKVVLKSEIIEALWEEVDIDKAFSHLYVSIYNIRQSLREMHDYIEITNQNGGYLLNFKNVSLDIKEWKKQLFHRPDLNIDNLSKYEEIMGLYRGSYLNSHDYLWLQADRFKLEETWLRYAKLMADCYQQNSLFEKAVAWYTIILENRPEDEQAAFSLMRIYAILQYRMLVDFQYKELKKSLDELNLNMNPEITSWYNNWSTTNIKQESR
ncbi:response regulator [Gracilibacillus massiliensis]|uniref:response regulator n=1 Tax=Gracilibacillus massiliensis TaxID=1564956 RepID=UPI00071C49E5|nr:response regulator [Gracilibacillus massiliensis]